MNEVMVNEERGMAVRNSQTEMMVNRQAQEYRQPWSLQRDFREMKWIASTGS